MACINFDQLPVGPVAPVLEEMTPILRERLLFCEHFGVWRLQGQSPVWRWRGGAAARARMPGGQGPVGARRREVTPLAKVTLSSCRPCWESVPAGRRARSPCWRFRCRRARNPMKKLIVFDLDGTLAESKSSLDAEMAGLAQCPAQDREGIRDIRRRLVPIRKTGACQSIRMTSASKISPFSQPAEPSSTNTIPVGRSSIRKISPAMRRKESSVH